MFVATGAVVASSARVIVPSLVHMVAVYFAVVSMVMGGAAAKVRVGCFTGFAHAPVVATLLPELLSPPFTRAMITPITTSGANRYRSVRSVLVCRCRFIIRSRSTRASSRFCF